MCIFNLLSFLNQKFFLKHFKTNHSFTLKKKISKLYQKISQKYHITNIHSLNFHHTTLTIIIYILYSL